MTVVKGTNVGFTLTIMFAPVAIKPDPAWSPKKKASLPRRLW